MRESRPRSRGTASRDPQPSNATRTPQTGKGKRASRSTFRDGARQEVPRRPTAAPDALPAAAADAAAEPLLAAEQQGTAPQPVGADDVQHVHLRAGDVLTVSASSADPIELVLDSDVHGVVAEQTGQTVRVTHVADTDEWVRVDARAPGQALLASDPSVQLMVAVEPVGHAESTAEADGAVYLNARQHMLLNLFGVTPRALHPGTGLALAESLDALALVARSAAASPEAVPASAGDHALTVQHSADGAVEHATYELRSDNATLVLHTVFDAGSGSLRCRLSYEDTHGATVRGSLQHTVALADGVPAAPAADPVGGYLAAEPGAPGALDDFSDLISDAGAGSRSAEGIGSFLEGALAGDFAGNDSWSATAGQVGIGLVPGAGQMADIRDIAAAGADLLQGREGAWVHLGITVIAVIPGLDFLKGGTKAGRKALREAADEATQGTAKSGLKHASKVLSKEAANRAARGLHTIAIARRELLARWQLLLADNTLSPDTRIALRKARNALQDHLTPADLSGALRDNLGMPVRASGSGSVWNHLEEVDSALNSLDKVRDALGRDLHRLPHGSAEFRRISAEMDAIQETVHRIEQFKRIR